MTETNYYYNLPPPPPPPPIAPLCPCCGLTQSFTTMDPMLDPPMVYYPLPDHFHS